MAEREDEFAPVENQRRSGAMKRPNRRVRDPLARLMRKRGWHYRTPSNGLRHRIHDLTASRHRWWDWGHPLMILTGVDFGGSWSEPTPPTWWYRKGDPKHQVLTRFPKHPLSTFEVIKDYATFRARTEGLNEDGMYEWQAIGTNQDGDLHLGHQYWGGGFYGLNHWDVALLRRYLRMWHRLDWFGMRSWLYRQGLHQAVHTKRPFRCNLTPPRGSGGYSHWYCGLKRKHDGPHRFGNYEWDPEKPRVEYAPVDNRG
jgi:hypothetical protein